VKALIIEDEVLIALLMADQLETWEWTTTVVTNGRKALEVLVSESFDLAVVNLGLPGESGPDLIRRMQRVAPGMRLIVCTGYPTEIAIARGVPADIRVLEKPCPEAEFLSAVRATMAGAGPRLNHPTYGKSP